jgi:phosphatidylserine/phosphatidylglycerophosphate/cardiolipin synthase-like enzyme
MALPNIPTHPHVHLNLSNQLHELCPSGEYIPQNASPTMSLSSIYFTPHDQLDQLAQLELAYNRDIEMERYYRHCAETALYAQQQWGVSIAAAYSQAVKDNQALLEYISSADVSG